MPAMAPPESPLLPDMAPVLKERLRQFSPEIELQFAIREDTKAAWRAADTAAMSRNTTQTLAGRTETTVHATGAPPADDPTTATTPSQKDDALKVSTVPAATTLSSTVTVGKQMGELQLPLVQRKLDDGR
eukprot:RCo006964